MNAAEAVLPEELVEIVEGVGSGHFVQTLHPAQLRGGLQQLPRPRRFVLRAAPHLQGLTARQPGRLVKPADKKRVLEVSPLGFKNSREERHLLSSGRSTFFSFSPPADAFYLVALSSLPALTCTSSTTPNSYCMSISLHRPLFNAPSPRAGKGGWVWDETWIERTYYFV